MGQQWGWDRRSTLSLLVASDNAELDWLVTGPGSGDSGHRKEDGSSNHVPFLVARGRCAIMLPRGSPTCFSFPKALFLKQVALDRIRKKLGAPLYNQVL